MSQLSTSNQTVKSLESLKQKAQNIVFSCSDLSRSEQIKALLSITQDRFDEALLASAIDDARVTF